MQIENVFSKNKLFRKINAKPNVFRTRSDIVGVWSREALSGSEFLHFCESYRYRNLRWRWIQTARVNFELDWVEALAQTSFGGLKTEMRSTCARSSKRLHWCERMFWVMLTSFRLIDWFRVDSISDTAGVGEGSDTNSHKKTSEINELESGNESLKIWAHKIKTPKSYSLVSPKTANSQK